MLNRLVHLALGLSLLVTAVQADVFEPGDLVIPGHRVLDPYTAYGCMYRLRDGQITRWFESPKYRAPHDMVVDSQGRLVFVAWPNSGNPNDAALYRLDPTDGGLERLFRFPYYVAVGDTLPDGAEDLTRMYPAPFQSLHLEKAFAVEINDDENGGWPQVAQPECYGFSNAARNAGGNVSTAFRWRNDTDRCEVGVALGLFLPWKGPVVMMEGGGWIYYGQTYGHLIGRAKPHVRMSLNLDGEWGSFQASLTATPRNELWLTGSVFDNTAVPNGSVDCDPLHDENVPFAWVGSTGFYGFAMNGLGILDGSVYATTNGLTPYLFSISDRAPFLNPYDCQYNAAMQGDGIIPHQLPDGTLTAARYTSLDGGAVIGNELGVIHRVTPVGDHSIVVSQSGDQAFTGRPWRWSGSSAKQPATKAIAEIQVLTLRADALVHVLLTDGLGQRIGFDAAGNPVNDFGARGQTIVGPGGWPKLVVLSDPELGISSVEVHTTGAGDWSVKGYLAHESAGGFSATTASSASGSETVLRGLYLGNPLGLSWHQSPTDTDLPASSRVSFVAGPVPANGRVRFAFRAPDAGAKVELAVFDLRGRRVALPISSTLLSGSQTLDWNGRGSDGRPLARGVYVARLSVDATEHTQRIVLNR